ncbi:hypothetical protein [Lacticaseibacillus hegangensis]|uniref:Uncharacterized protein n=1 Tax=Lacticaseibacillus hegangensis TaxID=2486010 RepID=A0ABW4CTL1_9LACO|nr:hypothetical protein [Lacticaseibacillus hegangensis]
MLLIDVMTWIITFISELIALIQVITVLVIAWRLLMKEFGRGRKK